MWSTAKYLLYSLSGLIVVLCLVALGWWCFLERRDERSAGLVIPGEVNVGELPTGQWHPLRIELRNPTGRSISVFDMPPV
jgi:hypothetical protein